MIREHWLMNNNELAVYYTLHMLVGMLEYKQEEGLPVTTKEILEYIENHIQIEEARLNKSYPNKA